MNLHEEESQVALFPDAAPRKAPAPAQKEKRRWEDGFQRWSDQQSLSGLTHYGACGYGAICNYCDGDPKGRACVRALNEMLRKKRLTIDYKSTTYENAFDGEFGKEEAT